MSKSLKADLPPHRLTRSCEMHFSGWRCTVCERTWSARPQTDCPGVKEYQWSSWPEGLFTKRQLAKQRLRPGLARGAIHYPKARGGWLWLYKLDEAIPAPARSPAQIAAATNLAERMRTGWTCKSCGGPLPRYVKDGGLCWLCRAREEAVTWAREILADSRVVILDTETTGLALGSEILQIALIDVQGNVLLDTLIHPETPTDESSVAFSINGITNAMVESAPRFSAMYEQLAAAVRDRVLIIYNRDYDLPIINTLAYRFGLPELEFADSACAMLMYAQFCGEWSDYHRDYRYQKLPGGDHSALGDCLATLVVLKEMAGGELSRNL